jgi:hypothetical protein
MGFFESVLLVVDMVAIGAETCFRSRVVCRRRERASIEMVLPLNGQRVEPF